MQVVVNKRRTRQSPQFRVEGDIPKAVISFLKETYGDRVDITAPEDETVNVFETEWFLSMERNTQPGVALRKQGPRRRPFLLGGGAESATAHPRQSRGRVALFQGRGG